MNNVSHCYLPPFLTQDALEAGYRGLTLESCDCGMEGIQLCNSFCFSGKRDPVRVFSNIADFLIDNPNEVMVVLIKASDQTLLRLFDLIFDESPGLRSLTYSHAGVTTEWPMLGELIDLNEVCLDSLCVSIVSLYEPARTWDSFSHCHHTVLAFKRSD